MWKAVVAVLIWVVPLAPQPLPESPYVSCIDGHIVKNLADCPPLRRGGGGGNGSGGVPLGGGGGNSGLLGLGIGGIL